MNFFSTISLSYIDQQRTFLLSDVSGRKAIIHRISVKVRMNKSVYSENAYVTASNSLKGDLVHDKRSKRYHSYFKKLCNEIE